MTTGPISGGAGLPTEIMKLMNELGHELRQESQDAARDAANLARAKGHEEADNLREQADDMRTGAMLGGITTLGGAALQAYGSAKLGMTPDASVPADKNLKIGESFVSLGNTVVQSGGYLNDLSQANGKLDEADARRAAADAQAANQVAESERADADEAQRLITSGRKAYGELISLEHQSKMAAIGGRA